MLLLEPGGEAIAGSLEGGLLSTVNLAEIHARLLRRGSTSDDAWNGISALKCNVCSFSPEQARIAAELGNRTQAFGLSLGDRACLALAVERKAKVYTADRTWKNLSLGIEIEVIR